MLGFQRASREPLAFVGPKHMLVLAGSVIAASALSGFVIKDGPDDPQGWIERKPGFGLDDVVFAALVVGVYWLAKKTVAKGV